MTRILKTIAAGAVLAIGIGATSVYAEQGQTTPPQSPPPQSEMQPHGMMGQHGSMMNGHMGGMMNMMGQMSQMMDHCNQMMQSHMRAPNSQWHQPSQPPQG
jgi:hypothetical protein